MTQEQKDKVIKEFDEIFRYPEHERMSKCDCRNDEEHERKIQWTGDRESVIAFLLQAIEKREKEMRWEMAEKLVSYARAHPSAPILSYIQGTDHIPNQ